MIKWTKWRSARTQTQSEPLGVLRSLRTKQKIEVENWYETHSLNNEENGKWIEDYIQRETTVLRKRVEDAETAIEQGQEDKRNVGNTGLIMGELEETSEEMMAPVGYSLSNLATADDDVNGDDEDDQDTVLGMPSEDD